MITPFNNTSGAVNLHYRVPANQADTPHISQNLNGFNAVSMKRVHVILNIK